jgi:hypothetical protein
MNLCCKAHICLFSSWFWYGLGMQEVWDEEVIRGLVNILRFGVMFLVDDISKADVFAYRGIFRVGVELPAHVNRVSPKVPR